MLSWNRHGVDRRRESGRGGGTFRVLGVPLSFHTGHPVRITDPALRPRGQDRHFFNLNDVARPQLGHQHIA